VLKRVITSLVLAPLVLAACVVGNPLFLFWLCLLVVTLSFWELRVMLAQPKALPVVTLFGLAVPFFGAQVQENRDPVQIILYASAFWIVGLVFVTAAARKGRTSSAAVDMSGLWVAMPMTCLLMLHKLMPHHAAHFGEGDYILLIVLPLWAGDIAGLLVGSKFGKHKLAPLISPKKSIEGAVANLLGCIGTSVALVPLIETTPHLVLHLVVGATIGIVGQLGDLFESWVKRTFGVKDSGSILPGHGGVLDRIDSLLFAAPVVCLELVFAFR
jgi:phosphatidate cytidylyltransferase